MTLRTVRTRSPGKIGFNGQKVYAAEVVMFRLENPTAMLKEIGEHFEHIT